MTTALRPLIACSIVMFLGCGPKDVIPNAPDHPANPQAPVGEEPLAPAPSTAPTEDKAVIAAAENAALERAKPVFAKYCATCHSSKGAKTNAKKLDHFNMDTYPFGGHHAMTIGETVREVLGVTGKPATMPKDNPGAVKGADLEAIVEWSKAFDRSHAAGLHHHGGDHDHGHEHPEEHQHEHGDHH